MISRRLVETRSVLFSDLDAQGIVYNAHYFKYIDDALDGWLRRIGVTLGQSPWEVVVKKMDIEWFSPLYVGELFEIVFSLSKKGNTSFELVFDAHALCPPLPKRGEGAELEGYPRRTFFAKALYVGVDGETRRPVPMPDWIYAELVEDDLGL